MTLYFPELRNACIHGEFCCRACGQCSICAESALTTERERADRAVGELEKQCAEGHKWDERFDAMEQRAEEAERRGKEVYEFAEDLVACPAAFERACEELGLAQSRLATAQEALQPFAALGDAIIRAGLYTDDKHAVWGVPGTEITIGDLRRAYAALPKEEGR